MHRIYISWPVNDGPHSFRTMSLPRAYILQWNTFIELSHGSLENTEM